MRTSKSFNMQDPKAIAKAIFAPFRKGMDYAAIGKKILGVSKMTMKDSPSGSRVLRVVQSFLDKGGDPDDPRITQVLVHARDQGIGTPPWLMQTDNFTPGALHPTTVSAKALKGLRASGFSTEEKLMDLLKKNPCPERTKAINAVLKEGQ